MHAFSLAASLPDAYACVQADKLQKKVAEAVKAHKAQEATVEAKCREHAGAQKLVLQLDKKAGKRRRDADSQARLLSD